MTRARYIALVSVAYMVTFVSMFLIAGDRPVQPAYQAIPVGAAFAIALAWIITARSEQLVLADRNSFAVPTIIHSLIVLVALAWVIYARVSGSGLSDT